MKGHRARLALAVHLQAQRRQFAVEPRARRLQVHEAIYADGLARCGQGRKHQGFVLRIGKRRAASAMSPR